VFPSRLPALEQEMIKEQIGASILRQGFKGGVFHCEGRVRNSSVEFTRSSVTGHFEMRPRTSRDVAETSIYLIENNARPPGYMATVTVAMTYGVDYFAQQILFALGPPERGRFLSLCQPYKNGPQFNNMLQFVAPEHSGRSISEDPAAELIRRVPHLADPDNVPIAYSIIQKGDWINGPKSNEITWLAWYIVTSRKSLTHLLDLGNDIQREYIYELE
jgi:hypothetical protein